MTDSKSSGDASPAAERTRSDDASPAPAGATDPSQSPLVDAAWLADRLADQDAGAEPDADADAEASPDVVPVDVREPWEFDALGHLPGAVNVPFDTFRDAGDADVGHLPGAEPFADVAGGAGLSRSDTLVAYDDTNGVFAARFLVTARVYGFEDVRVLDGDLSAWQREYPTTDDAPARAPVDVEPRRVDGATSPLVDDERVRTAIEGDGVLVDTRDPEEFAAGHLPGAIRFDWQEAVDAETRGVKPAADLETLLSDRGIVPDRPIVLYCNTARRLSHTYVVLRSLGYDDVGIYEGSLTEWRALDGELVTESE